MDSDGKSEGLKAKTPLHDCKQNLIKCLYGGQYTRKGMLRAMRIITQADKELPHELVVVCLTRHRD